MSGWRDFLGYCMNRGIGDPRDMYVDQLIALVWHLSTRDKKPEEIEYKRAQLWIPPEGVEIDERSPWHPKNQLAQLQRVKGTQKKIEHGTVAPSRDVPPPRPIPGIGGHG
jgi:hypothetical protein